MVIAPISSGSRGNSILIEDKNVKLLVDAGVSGKRIDEGLSFYGCHPADLDGMLITHEHIDHIQGLGVFLRKHEIPVYAPKETIEAILSSPKTGKVNQELFVPIKTAQHIQIKSVSVLPVPVQHDAVNPVCYRFDTAKQSCAVVTDLGCYDDALTEQLKELDMVLIEANHDIRMLQTGSYPFHLKQRIWGNLGHLSNENCGRLLSRIGGKRLKHIILGHLSGENNYPELAYQAVRNEINFAGNGIDADELDIQVASRLEPSCRTEI